MRCVSQNAKMTDERGEEQSEQGSERRDERPQQDRADLPHFLLQLGREQLQARVPDRDQRAGEVAERLEQPGDRLFLRLLFLRDRGHR